MNTRPRPISSGLMEDELVVCESDRYQIRRLKEQNEIIYLYLLGFKPKLLPNRMLVMTKDNLVSSKTYSGFTCDNIVLDLGIPFEDIPENYLNLTEFLNNYTKVSPESLGYYSSTRSIYVIDDVASKEYKDQVKHLIWDLTRDYPEWNCFTAKLLQTIFIKLRIGIVNNYTIAQLKSYMRDNNYNDIWKTKHNMLNLPKLYKEKKIKINYSNGIIQIFALVEYDKCPFNNEYIAVGEPIRL